jgi:hypothetical protein
MEKYTIELDCETIDRIVTDQLVDMIKRLSADLRDTLHGGGIAVFSHDPEEEVREILKHIDAAKLVLQYYGGEVN